MLRRLRQSLWPTSNMSEGARHAVNALRLAVGVLLVAVGLLVTRSLTESNRIDRRVSRAVASVCEFHKDIAEAPVPPNAQSLGVKILVDSRRAYQGLRCPGRLAPPSADLRRLAGRYHIPLT